MPRIYTSASDPLDFCRKCFPKTETAARAEYGDVGHGPDGRGDCFGYDDDHPSYANDDYRCCKCRKQLGKHDEFWETSEATR